MEARIWSLESIASLPLRLDGELYRHYPGMKLGQLHLVDFFSRRLYPLVESILLGAGVKQGEKSDWVVTAPACFHLPSAANLLARGLCALLHQRGFAVPLIEQRLNREQIAVRDFAEFAHANDYSRHGLEQRIAERRRVQDLAGQEAALPLFANRRVIIVNDIRVTGTQQHFMQRSLDEMHALECHWLYIFHLDAELAERHPELEFQINNSTIADLDSFAAVLDDERTEHTTRCLSRLFSQDMEDFRHIVALLKPATRNRISSLALAERRYGDALFAPKMRLLADTAHSIS